MKRSTQKVRNHRKSSYSLNNDSDNDSFYRLSRSFKVDKKHKATVHNSGTVRAELARNQHHANSKTSSRPTIKQNRTVRPKQEHRQHVHFDKSVKHATTKSAANPNYLNTWNAYPESDFKSRVYEFLEFSLIGFKFYLMSKNFTNLFIKHWIYLEANFNIEYFLAMLCGLLRSFYLVVSFLSDIINKRKREQTCEQIESNERRLFDSYNCVVFGSEMILFIVLGSTQLPFQMSVWDYKRKILSKAIFSLEISRFSLELFYCFGFFIFYFLKYKGKIN